MHSKRRSIKETPNASLMIRLVGHRVKPEKIPFMVKARPMCLRAGVDPAELNKFADELEMVRYVDKAKRRKKA